jgi:hypothetical protein
MRALAPAVETTGLPLESLLVAAPLRLLELDSDFRRQLESPAGVSWGAPPPRFAAVELVEVSPAAAHHRVLERAAAAVRYRRAGEVLEVTLAQFLVGATLRLLQRRPAGGAGGLKSELAPFLENAPRSERSGARPDSVEQRPAVKALRVADDGGGLSTSFVSRPVAPGLPSFGPRIGLGIGTAVLITLVVTALVARPSSSGGVDDEPAAKDAGPAETDAGPTVKPDEPPPPHEPVENPFLDAGPPKEPVDAIASRGREIYSRDDLFDVFIERAREDVKLHPKAYVVPFALIKAVIKRESAFDPKARSHAGAIGLMQVMPFNAPNVGLSAKDLYEAEANVLGGTRLLSLLLDYYGGHLRSALAAYNAKARRLYAEVPQNGETPQYVEAVTRYYREYLVRHPIPAGEPIPR